MTDTKRRNIFTSIEPRDADEAELVLESTTTFFSVAKANKVSERELEPILDTFIQRTPDRIAEAAHIPIESPTVQGYMLMSILASELTRMAEAHRELSEAGVTDAVVNVYVHMMFRSIDREFGEDVGAAMRRLIKWED